MPSHGKRLASLESRSSAAALACGLQRAGERETARNRSQGAHHGDRKRCGHGEIRATARPFHASAWCTWSDGLPCNIDAACWFTRHAWPAIHQRFPEWRLTLIGSNPAASVRELAREPNVEVTGTVPDVVPYYRDALAAIVPLRTGGGTRLKILEAMAAGVPWFPAGRGRRSGVSPGQDIEVLDDDSGWLPR